MEVDLRSKEKNERTLRFAVNGKGQKYCFTGLPENIRFGVWIIIYLLLSFSIIHFSSIRFAWLRKMITSNSYHIVNCQNRVWKQLLERRSRNGRKMWIVIELLYQKLMMMSQRALLHSLHFPCITRMNQFWRTLGILLLTMELIDMNLLLLIKLYFMFVFFTIFVSVCIFYLL